MHLGKKSHRLSFGKSSAFTVYFLNKDDHKISAEFKIFDYRTTDF